MDEAKILFELHLIAEEYRRRARVLTEAEDWLRELIDKELENEEQNEKT